MVLVNVMQSEKCEVKIDPTLVLQGLKQLISRQYLKMEMHLKVIYFK